MVWTRSCWFKHGALRSRRLHSFVTIARHPLQISRGSRSCRKSEPLKVRCGWPSTVSVMQGGVTVLPGNLTLDAARMGQGIAVTAGVWVQADIDSGRFAQIVRR